MDKIRSTQYPPLGLTMDPSKGGLALQQGGAEFAALHRLAQFSTYDPGFAERAANFSAFGRSACYGQLLHPYASSDSGSVRELSETVDGNLSRISSFSARIHNKQGEESKREVDDEPKRDDGDDQHRDSAVGTSTRRTSVETSEGAKGNVNIDEGDALDHSSCSEQVGSRGGVGAAPGKRKGKDYSAVSLDSLDAQDGKGTEGNESKTKRLKAGGTGGSSRESDVGVKVKAERSSASEHSGDSSPRSLKASSKLPEPPKQDYIHVRARRGQATDSHSLAERVRREKISERMKFLQDLVPGCSKVTGKAVMLDEIINYVQSLQRQIEFLSMKLASVNPQLDYNLDTVFSKEMMQSRSPETTLMGPDPLSGYGDRQSQRQMRIQSNPCSLDFRSLENTCDSYLRRSMSGPSHSPLGSADDFLDPLSQTSSVSDGDLQSIVQMGFNPGRHGFFTQALHGASYLPPGHLKVEL